VSEIRNKRLVERRGTRRQKLTPEEEARRAARVRQKRLNEKKLAEFLADEQRVERRALSLLASMLPPTTAIQAMHAFHVVTRYADPVIEAFHAQTSVSRRMYAADFDPKAEYDNFIASYVGRFGEVEQPKAPPAKRSRKGIGGRPVEDLTQEGRKVLEEAKATNVTLTFDDVCEKTWAALHPGRDRLKAKSAWTLHVAAVRKRLAADAPELLPKKRGRKPKR
jgi:hypothetical protein